MNRLGVYDVDAAFDKMSLQTTDEFGLDAILERLVRAADVEGVRRLIEVSTPYGHKRGDAALDQSAHSRRRVAVLRVVADGRQYGRQRSRVARGAGARAIISEATRRQASKAPARGAHDDAPPLLAQGRPCIRADPRLLLVRQHR